METVKVICEVTEGNPDGYYICNADSVPDGDSLVGEEPKKATKKAK